MINEYHGREDKANSVLSSRSGVWSSSALKPDSNMSTSKVQKGGFSRAERVCRSSRINAEEEKKNIAFSHLLCLSILQICP